MEIGVLHDEAFLVDAAPPLSECLKYVDLNNAGGDTGVGPTLATAENPAEAFRSMPLALSYSNAKTVPDIAGNISDDRAKTAAITGGLVAVTRTVDDFEHLNHFSDLVGIDHVALSPDYYRGRQPFASDDEADELRSKFGEAEISDPSTYPCPRRHYRGSLATPVEMAGRASALTRRGFSNDEML